MGGVGVGDAVVCCETCRFMQDTGRLTWERLVECRRHAPRAGVPDPTSPLPTRIFPVNRAVDWCGDYERREQ